MNKLTPQDINTLLWIYENSNKIDAWETIEQSADQLTPLFLKQAERESLCNSECAQRFEKYKMDLVQLFEEK